MQIHNEKNILLMNNSSGFGQKQIDQRFQLSDSKDYCSERIDLRLSELNWFSRKIVQNI